MTIQVGDTSLPSRVLLAPMSGVTDLAFRQAVARVSNIQVVSEMVASEELVKARPDVVLRAEGAGLDPFILQLAGRDPHWMLEGAKLACAAGADIVDINMGCPSLYLIGSAATSSEAKMRSLERLRLRMLSVILPLISRMYADDDPVDHSQ